MVRSNLSRLLLRLFVVFGLVAAACGSSDSSTSTTAASDDQPAATEAPEETAPPEEGDTTEGTEEMALDLSGVCPNPLVIQTDWFPEAEHGALYEMVGDDYVIDSDAKTVNGTLMASGVPAGINIEVRTGGPAIGFQPVSSQMYTDDSIHLGYANTDEQGLFYDSAPTIAVVAPLEVNPQMIMWDPESYPDIKTLADLGEAGITINIFPGGLFSDVFLAQGIWSEDQVDPSYDGSPARFISSGGAVAQQGFASAEPYLYQNEITEWGKPVAFQLLHDAGFEVYPQPLVVRSGDLESLSPCLEQFVPIVQQSVIDYIASPDRANAIIVDTVAAFNDFWIYGDGVAAFSVQQQRDLNLASNGPDSTVGNLDLDRVQRVIDVMTEAGMTVPDGLTADQITTNEFIDESIGF